VGINRERISTLVLMSFLVYALANNFINNSNSGVIGYDEGIYIINAMGHYEETPIGHPVGNWLDAIEKGMMRTGDPPGFFFALHFWEKLSMSEPWLRALPFLFFCIGVFTIIRVGFLLGIPPVVSVALGYLPLASAQSVYHSIELRAYAMELGFSYLAIYFSLKLFQSISYGKTIKGTEWLILTIIMLIGVTSRWSFMITTTACYTSLFVYMIYKSKQYTLQKNIVYLIFSAVIVYSFFALVYLMIFGTKYGINFQFLSDLPLISLNIGEYIQSHQSANILFVISRLVSILLTYPGMFYGEWMPIMIAVYSTVFLLFAFYLSIIVKKYIKSLPHVFGWVMIVMPFLLNPQTLSTILESRESVTFNLKLLLWLLDGSSLIMGFVLISKRQFFSINLGKSISPQVKENTFYLGLFLIPVMALLISMILSYLNLYPLTPRSRVSLYLEAHYNIFIVGLLYFIVYKMYLHDSLLSKPNSFRRIKNALTVGIMSLSILHGVLYLQYNILYRGGGAQHTPDAIRSVITDEDMKDIDFWYVSLGEANSFKYHMLYGKLKGNISPDAQVIFEKWGFKQKDINKQLSSIHKKMKQNDKIIMLTGHAGERDKKYLSAFSNVFGENIEIGDFIQSSMFGETSLGGEQAYYIGLQKRVK